MQNGFQGFILLFGDPFDLFTIVLILQPLDGGPSDAKTIGADRVAVLGVRGAQQTLTFFRINKSAV